MAPAGGNYNCTSGPGAGEGRCQVIVLHLLSSVANIVDGELTIASLK